MDPLLMRFIERMTAVLIGALCIYFGYRLFLHVPEQRDGEGKFVLPLNTSVVMTRVGPGVFFAFFGIAAVCFALYQQLEMKGGAVSYVGKMSTPDERSDARALLRREMATLNTIPRLLRTNLGEHERDSVQRSLRRVKLLLLNPVWGEPGGGFGDFSTFQQWVEANEPSPPPSGMDEALVLYRYGEVR
jgi:hypothetical protein